MPHDVLNRLTSLDNTGITGVPAVVFNYLYDAVGDRINGSIAGQTDYSFDQLNRVTKITQFGTGVQNKRVDMTYNKVNQMTGLNRFSNLGGQSLVAETSYTYDQNQRLIQLAHKKGVNNLTSYDYTYDSANKLTKIASSLDGTIDYSYDATNQLTGAEHSSQTDEAYQYDANGNRTNAGYQTGTNNQLQADGQFIYEYDGEGNRTKRTEIATGKVTEYVWDYRNRLTGVLFKSAAGVVEKNVEYVYDTNNLRIGKKIDGVVTERFAIDRDQIALVFDGSGVQKSRYLYGTQIDQVLAEESGAQVHWFLTDHQGTVKDVVDNTGTVIDHVTYDSFGRIVGQTSSIDLRFAYTGREFDSETGQYYYRARYYDAAVGKFISEDPIGFAGGDSNLSRYVGNSAPNLIDPSGLQALEFNPIEKLIDEGGKAVAAAAALAAAATAKAAVDTYNAANNASGGAIGDGLNATGRFIGDRARDVDRFLVPPVADATLPPRPFRNDRPKPLPIPTIEPKTKLLPKPVPRNNPTPNPSPKGRPDLIPDPNCPEDKKKKTCKEKYPTYSTLSELAIEPFGGFKYSTLTDAKNSLQEIRANHSLPAVQEEGRLYPTGKRYFVEAINYGCKGPKKGHKDQPLHYNGITERTRFRDPIEQISGGSIGYCKVCTDSDSDARLIDRFIVLNVKNRQGTQSFTTY